MKKKIVSVLLCAAIGVVLSVCVVLVFTVCNKIMKDDDLEFEEGGEVMAKVKEKKIREKFNWKKELKLAPGYIIIIAWVIFTFILLGWVLGASFSTTQDIFQGKALNYIKLLFKGDFGGFADSLHFENYAKAWTASNVATFFTNSLCNSNGYTGYHGGASSVWISCGIRTFG